MKEELGTVEKMMVSDLKEHYIYSIKNIPNIVFRNMDDCIAALRYFKQEIAQFENEFFINVFQKSFEEFEIFIELCNRYLQKDNAEKVFEGMVKSYLSHFTAKSMDYYFLNILVNSNNFNFVRIYFEGLSPFTYLSSPTFMEKIIDKYPELEEKHNIDLIKKRRGYKQYAALKNNDIKKLIVGWANTDFSSSYVKKLSGKRINVSVEDLKKVPPIARFHFMNKMYGEIGSLSRIYGYGYRDSNKNQSSYHSIVQQAIDNKYNILSAFKVPFLTKEEVNTLTISVSMTYPEQFEHFIKLYDKIYNEFNNTKFKEGF